MRNLLSMAVCLVAALVLTSCSGTDDVIDPGSATVMGNVTDRANSAPVAGASVDCDGKVSVTDSDGVYLIDNVAVGQQTLTVTKDGYHTTTQTIQVVHPLTEHDASIGTSGPKTVFLGTRFLPANFWSLEFADDRCASMAGNAGLTGTFRAWLSDDHTSAADRFVQSEDPYVRVDGVQVAANFADLVDSVLDAPINVDEYGQPVSNGWAWTGTNSDGQSHGSEGSNENCSNWMYDSASRDGLVGSASSRFGSWTEDHNAPCSYLERLYCFEQ